MNTNTIARDHDSFKFIARLTAALVAILATLAFILSYSSLQHMAANNGVSERLSYLWPLLLDFAMMVFSLAILRANLRQESAKYPWTLTICFAALATVANVLDVANLGLPPVFIAASVKALAPVALVLSFELLMSMIRAELRQSNTVHSLIELNEQQAKAQEDIAKLLTQIEGHRKQLALLQAEIEEHKPAPKPTVRKQSRQAQMPAMIAEGMSETEIAQSFEVSLKTIKRDIEDLNGRVS
ncbi:MAG: DUF2637 domain-containing protein [Chloroflexota bacterium]